MKRRRKILDTRGLFMFLVFAFMITGAAPAFCGDFGEVEKILGVVGQVQEGVMVFSFPGMTSK